MQATRPLLPSSYSFSGLPAHATVAQTAERAQLKRRMSSIEQLATVHPAAASMFAAHVQDLFAPSQASQSQVAAAVTTPLHFTIPTTNSARAQPQNMDPTTDDPTAVFIHPPFDSFVTAESPEGLNYNMMAEHADWFLDSRDFKAANNDNPNAVAYPAQLEPPRGWCPNKKKELKQLGTEGWPEGEEPRLRCTFCRRTYAGVNAKSMWRRHVYEKHKIAMANRRDGTERVRGRQSNSMSQSSLFGAIPPDPLV
jgi:hypothetical protein